MRSGTAIVLAAAILSVGSVSTAAILSLSFRARVAQVTPSAQASPIASTSPIASASPTASVNPTSPRPTPAPFPPAHIDPSLNFAGGDFLTGTGFNSCQMRVNFSASSRRDGTGASGTFIMTVVQGAGCEGQATGKIACLLVTANHAILDGWMDNPTGVFSAGDIMQATVTQNDPQIYGPPVDRAGFGIASGSPECPPAIEGNGPAIRSGTILVSQAK